MEPGERVGRYVIDRVLGEGAVGVVCLASDPLIGRKVALKTLRGDLEGDYALEFQQRFLREASAAGRLSHPNITTVYDVGRDQPTGIVFIAMEYVEGSTLEALAEEGAQLELERAVELGSTLAEALGYAHGEGVVHRDVKPANILMTTAGVPKITDFGIARLESSNLTVEGAVLGTPYYMSPEQVNGLPVDGRTDLYALGIILFELLTGTRPFAGRSLMTMIGAIINQPPPDLAALRPEIPAALAAVVRRALDKKPEARYQTGSELAAALRGVDLRPQPQPMEEVGATVIGVSLASLGGLSGVLHFVAGNRRVHLRSKNELVIGRDPHSDIHLANNQVSRRHGIITLDDDVVRFADLSSSNGSTVNGAPVVAPAELQDGDVVGIGGNVHFLVRFRRRLRPPLSVALIADQDEYLLCRGEVALGRDPHSVDIRIADRLASPVHAWIEPAVGAPLIRSDGPFASFFVNGQPVERSPLVDRTTVQIGSTQMVWLDAETSRAHPGPTRY